MSNSYKLTGREIHEGDFFIEAPLGDTLLFDNEAFNGDAGYNVYLSCYGNPDEIFFDGIETVNTYKNDDCVNVYINCNFDCTEIEDHLEVCYWRTDDCVDCIRELNEKEQLIIKKLILGAQIYYLNFKHRECTHKLKSMN